MARDPLRVLLAVRQRSVDQARFALGVSIAAEAGVAARIRAHDDALRRDREVSGAWEDALQFHEMSARRLAAMRVSRRQIEVELAAAEVRSAEARDIVTAARTAAEVVEQLIDERAAASLVEANKREQHVLDDIARARHAARRRQEVS